MSGRRVRFRGHGQSKHKRYSKRKLEKILRGYVKPIMEAVQRDNKASIVLK